MQPLCCSVVSLTYYITQQHWPSVTVSRVYVHSKVQQKLDYMVVSSADSVMKRSDAFVIRHAGIFHLGEMREYILKFSQILDAERWHMLIAIHSFDEKNIRIDTSLKNKTLANIIMFKCWTPEFTAELKIVQHCLNSSHPLQLKSLRVWYLQNRACSGCEASECVFE